MSIRNDLLEEILAAIEGGGGGGGGTTFGPLTNAQILAIPAPVDENTAFSTDDFIVYTYYNGSWYSTGGGVLS